MPEANGVTPSAGAEIEAPGEYSQNNSENNGVKWRREIIVREGTRYRTAIAVPQQNVSARGKMGCE